jgi:hypothetical protein
LTITDVSQEHICEDCDQTIEDEHDHHDFT